MSVVAIAVAVLGDGGPPPAAEYPVGPASTAERPAPEPVGDSPDQVSVVLGDGTTLWLDGRQAVKQLSEGVTIRLMYEERNRQHVVTSVEAAE